MMLNQEIRLEFEEIVDSVRGCDSDLQSSFSVLDCFSHGLLLLDIDGLIVFMNHQANQILGQKDGLSVAEAGYRLRVHCKETQRLVDTVIQDTIRLDSAGVSRRTLAIPRISAKIPYLLQVSTLPRLDGKKRKSDKVRLMVLVHDAENRHPCSISILKSVFRLTDAEARVALLATELATIKEIARRRNVGFDTVKTQLCRVYEKTQTKNRANLVRLLLQMGMPVLNDKNATSLYQMGDVYR